MNIELTESIPNWAYYPQWGILSTIGDLKSPIGNNIPNWGFGMYKSSRELKVERTNW